MPLHKILLQTQRKKLGEKKFREKYQFKCSELIRMNIEDGIRDAVNKANPLG